jgi:DNA-binding XRE family transcriptional regulator
MTVQIIRKAGEPEWAVLPYETYLKLVEDAEMLADIRDYDAAREAVDAGEEMIPARVVYAMLDGQSPVKVWREYRGLTQQQLATAAGISASYLSQIESGVRTGRPDVLQAIAGSLQVDVDDILTSESKNTGPGDFERLDSAE